MSVLLKAEIRGLSEVQGVESHDRESERAKSEVLDVR